VFLQIQDKFSESFMVIAEGGCGEQTKVELIIDVFRLEQFTIYLLIDTFCLSHFIFISGANVKMVAHVEQTILIQMEYQLVTAKKAFQVCNIIFIRSNYLYRNFTCVRSIL